MEISDLTKFIITAIIGAIAGIGGTVYSYQTASIAENQFFMQMDFRRYQTASDTAMSIEEKQATLIGLKEAYSSGYESVFSKNLDDDIKAVKASIARIKEQEKISAEAAEKARLEEKKKAEQIAKTKAQEAVRRNPIIFEACRQPSSRVLCP